jgi:polysaccharide biosynthesis/export protein
MAEKIRSTMHHPTRFCLSLFGRLLAVVLLALPAIGALSAYGAEGAQKPTPRPGTYKLRPMDVIKIQVFQEPDLDRELRISQDHTIVAPLIGVVNLKDRTVRETELLITKLYKQDYLINPQINVTVTEYAQRAVNVLGAVNSPGSVALPPEKDLTLLDVIARAGGFSRLANRTRISLTRTLSDGETVNYVVNADQLVSGDMVDGGPIQDGDIISVPERML